MEGGSLADTDSSILFYFFCTDNIYLLNYCCFCVISEFP